jgi:hypothetical protein
VLGKGNYCCCFKFSAEILEARTRPSQERLETGQKEKFLKTEASPKR